ncbi:MAG TPA: hypothetical protein VHL30_00815 [Chlamydiales bacterium]|jgi:hypothetical protein|nr:hypothetical protein [Chlamydiales bacterium]
MIHFISAAAVTIHDDLIETYGGAKGIRDYGLLLSALDMPNAANIISKTFLFHHNFLHIFTHKNCEFLA